MSIRRKDLLETSWLKSESRDITPANFSRMQERLGSAEMQTRRDELRANERRLPGRYVIYEDNLVQVPSGETTVHVYDYDVEELTLSTHSLREVLGLSSASSVAPRLELGAAANHSNLLRNLTEHPSEQPIF